jgi:hypothetical protein
VRSGPVVGGIAAVRRGGGDVASGCGRQVSGAGGGGLLGRGGGEGRKEEEDVGVVSKKIPPRKKIPLKKKISPNKISPEKKGSCSPPYHATSPTIGPDCL